MLAADPSGHLLPILEHGRLDGMLKGAAMDDRATRVLLEWLEAARDLSCGEFPTFRFPQPSPPGRIRSPRTEEYVVTMHQVPILRKWEFLDGLKGCGRSASGVSHLGSAMGVPLAVASV